MSRVGIGYDIHRLVEGRPLILGGVRIESKRGLDGHSDADVLSHAIADALLGAAGERDIGFHFPNDDPAIEGISSLTILERVRAILKEATILNVDASVIAEEPKIAPFIAAMRSNIAKALGTSENCIGIKATTNERLGAIGQGEGIAAMAVASIQSA
jgi:2-C-methyl-D-erythritol 2,4-cyclodiphosphate synthase